MPVKWEIICFRSAFRQWEFANVMFVTLRNYVRKQTFSAGLLSADVGFVERVLTWIESRVNSIRKFDGKDTQIQLASYNAHLLHKISIKIYKLKWILNCAPLVEAICLRPAELVDLIRNSHKVLDRRFSRRTACTNSSKPARLKWNLNRLGWSQVGSSQRSTYTSAA